MWQPLADHNQLCQATRERERELPEQSPKARKKKKKKKAEGVKKKKKKRKKDDDERSDCQYLRGKKSHRQEERQ